MFPYNGGKGELEVKRGEPKTSLLFLMGGGRIPERLY